MNKMILLASIVLLTTACNLQVTPTPVNSGITGKVTVGPMCPVMIEGQDCPDQPYQATITVNNPEGKKIVQFQTDKQGNFKVSLMPGEYILHPETPQGTLETSLFTHDRMHPGTRCDRNPEISRPATVRTGIDSPHSDPGP